MVPALIISILFFSLVLIKAADLLITALTRLARSTHTGVFALSAVILALGTSFPELFIGITSAIEGSPNLTLGVVLGSNIANIALVGGLTAIIIGKINVHGDFVKRDVWIALIAALLPILLIYDLSLSRVDGLILISTYLAYAMSFFRERFEEVGKRRKDKNFVFRFFRKFNNISSSTTKEYGRLFIGVSLLLFSADMIVKISENLAFLAGIPLFIIGLFVLAIGTSLPEFAFSLRSIEDNHPSMFFGNLLGSTIANSTLILGVTSLIYPISVGAISEYLIAVIAFVVIFVLFWIFIRSKHELTRKEGLILLFLYLIFVVIEFI